MMPMDWLNQADAETGQTNLAVLARLWCKNRGDFYVREWDVFADGMPYYDGRYGLTWEEALDLIELGHYLNGLIAAFNEIHKDEVGVMIADEIQKHRRWTPGLYGEDDFDDRSDDPM